MTLDNLGSITEEMARNHQNDMENGHCSNALHAEVNAVAQAAKYGISLEGCVAYVTHAPCIACYRLMMASGVSLVLYGEAYRLHPEVAASVHVRKVDVGAP